MGGSFLLWLLRSSGRATGGAAPVASTASGEATAADVAAARRSGHPKVYLKTNQNPHFCRFPK